MCANRSVCLSAVGAGTGLSWTSPVLPQLDDANGTLISGKGTLYMNTEQRKCNITLRLLNNMNTYTRSVSYRVITYNNTTERNRTNGTSKPWAILPPKRCVPERRSEVSRVIRLIYGCLSHCRRVRFAATESFYYRQVSGWPKCLSTRRTCVQCVLCAHLSK